MTVKLLTEIHLEFQCTGSSEYIHVKLPHRWKSHVATHFILLGRCSCYWPCYCTTSYLADTFLFLRLIIFWFIFSGQLEHDHGTTCCVSFRDFCLCCQWATSRYGLFNYQMMGKHMAHWDLNPFKTDGIFHKATYNKIRTVHCIYRGKGFRVKNSKKYCYN